MPPIDRRHFLQFAGSTLASIGLSQLDFLHQGDRYAKVLAQGKPGRKLALLVGINRYPEGISTLRGCLMDVELQRELLVHRYGFNPKDILIVSDKEALKPDRATLLEAFQTHLVKQAKPGDVVVFHFSGHGSLVKDPNPLPELFKNENGVSTRVQNQGGVNGTLVPNDRFTADPNQVQDIMGKSLFLLTYGLKTDNVTLILDSCHSGGGTRGNLLFRSTSSRQDGLDTASPSQVELAFQEKLMKDLGLSESEFQRLRQQGIAKGVAIGSAQYDQLSADAPFDNEAFYAGAFTYLLTRYLWQQSVDEAIGTVFVNLARSTRDVSNRTRVAQEPFFAANPERHRQQPTYFLKPPTPFAEAVVQSISPSDQIEFWLGGISSSSLNDSKRGSIFSVIDKAGKEIAQIEQTDRKGLVATGRLKTGKLANLQPGALLRERVRGLPTNLKLRVGLDPSLGKDLETVKAALQEQQRMTIVASDQVMNYRLGRMTSTYQNQFSQQGINTFPKVGSTGLFTGDLRPLTATFGDPEETIEAAIERLAPRLQAFLAAEVLKAIGGVDVVTGGQFNGLKVDVQSMGTQVAINQFIPGTQIQIQIQNTSDRDLYVSVISLGDAGRMRVLFPYVDFAEGRERLTPSQALTVPEPGINFRLGSPGLLEIIVLSSSESLRDALKALKEIGVRGGISSSRGVSQDALSGQDSVNVVEAMLGNINRNSRSDVVTTVDNPLVDATRYGVIAITIKVVPE